MDFRQEWALLRTAIDSQIGTLTPSNIKETSILLFQVNIIWGRGLVCRSIIDSVLKSPQKSPELAALVAVLNSKLPEVGELVLARTQALFKKAYLENQRRLADSMAMFICELVLQAVSEDIIVLQMLQLALEKQPTDDSISLAAKMLYRVGGHLDTKSKAAANMIFDRLRALLQESKVLSLSQKRITELLRLRRDGMTLSIDKRLDLVEDEDRETHFVDFTEEQDMQVLLNFFLEELYKDCEEEYAQFKESVLDPVDEPEAETVPAQEPQKVSDMTNAELLQHQKSIYLTVMSSMSADEAVHKLMRLKRTLKLSNDVLIDMIIKCCAQEKTYSKYFGLIGEKICGLAPQWHDTFARQFVEKYDAIFQYEGAQLRNMGKFFGHLIAADILSPQETLGYIELTEDSTTSAGRVFIKFVFQELVEELGIGEVKKVVQDPYVRSSLRSLFPVVDVTKADTNHIMFAINYFTAIGLGVLTEEMRAVLKDLPEEPRGRKRRRTLQSGLSRSGSFSRSSSRSRSYSRSRSGSYSRSRSGSYSRSRSRSYSRSRSRSYSRSRSASRSRSRSYSRSPLRGPTP